MSKREIGLDVTKTRKLETPKVFCQKCGSIQEVEGHGYITARTHPYERKSIYKYPELILNLKCRHVLHIVVILDGQSLKEWLQVYGEETT